MMYMKMIQDNHVVDVGCAFLRWDDKLNRLFICECIDADFIQSHDEQHIYHCNWIHGVRTDKVEYQEAEIVVIERAEYDELLALLGENEIVNVPPEAPEVQVSAPKEVQQPEQPMTIAEMRETIINQQKQIDMLLEKFS